MWHFQPSSNVDGYVLNGFIFVCRLRFHFSGIQNPNRVSTPIVLLASSSSLSFSVYVTQNPLVSRPFSVTITLFPLSFPLRQRNSSGITPLCSISSPTKSRTQRNRVSTPHHSTPLTSHLRCSRSSPSPVVVDDVDSDFGAVEARKTRSNRPIILNFSLWIQDVKVVFFVFNPALVGNNLARTITLESIISM
ncbi:unnamed protein product [Lactuca saligna]|uniref:Uncharacterized protein n=1 Tax=Lactuca saligna TaxID=75948 RepID=A0AA35YHK5_LACSI|nr:unnamed protein product [Lactuca saligna]